MPNDRIVGIDLGTTNSLVAFMQGDTPVVIPGEDGLNLVPSVVALGANDEIIVGSTARKYLIETPERAVYSIKRLMGRGVEDIQEELKMQKKSGEDDPALIEEIGRQKLELEEKHEALLEELHRDWNDWDRAVDAGTESDRLKIRDKMVDLLNRRKYLMNLVAQIEEALGN